MRVKSETRPAGVTALSVFFAFGAAASFLSFVSLLFPGSFLGPMWRLNPQARESFAGMGWWAIALMCVVCAACSAAEAGLWRGARWGHRAAVSLLAINLLGDVANVVTGAEPRAAVGIPIVLIIIAFLLRRRVRGFFHKTARAGPES
jgi:hypothetical protein